MFAVPAPVPAAANRWANAFGSDSATEKYPTHQVITTLGSSRKRGDWGLKRPLPLKSTTKTTSALLRVKQIDSVEEITDFAPAPHAAALRRFQELNLPVSIPLMETRDKNSLMRRMNMPRRSVFEEDGDFTALDPEKQVTQLDKRWKFSGPWLAGMTPGEFESWLEKKVRPRRPEFRAFLKAKLAEEMSAEARDRAVDSGETVPAVPSPESVTEEQLAQYVQKLRSNNVDLYEMVGRFLDLAPLQPPPLSVMTGLIAGSVAEMKISTNPYAESGPPITHPSAGLSYLRTAMYMDNHPLYGPQKSHPPVEARMLRPRRVGLRNEAKFGVGGFVVDNPLGDTTTNQRRPGGHAIERFDPTVEGGVKMFTHPQSASIGADGRTVIEVGEAYETDTMIAQELIGAAKVLGMEMPEQRRFQRSSEIRSSYKTTFHIPTPTPRQSKGKRSHSYGLI